MGFAVTLPTPNPPAAAAPMEDLVLRHGATQVSCLAGTADKQRAVLDCGAVVGFRIAAGVAVVAGDPLGPEPVRAQAIAEFAARCRARRHAVCFLQTRPALRTAYRAAGLRVLPFGEEALLDLRGFSLESPRRANLRQELARARRAGLHAETWQLTDTSALLWQELRVVSVAWLARRPWRELGFSVGRFGEIVDAGGWVTVVRDGRERAQAFTTWMRLGPAGMALDMFRRRPDAPAGAMDLCITAALAAAGRRGLGLASLGIAPFRAGQPGAGGEDATDGGRFAESLRRWLFGHGTLGYDYRSLSRFKGKFAPRWEPRDIAVSRGLRSLAVPLALALVHFRPGDAPGG